MPFFLIDLATVREDDIDPIGIVEADSQEAAWEKLGIKPEEHHTVTHEQAKRVLIGDLNLHILPIANLGSREDLLNEARKFRLFDTGN